MRRITNVRLPKPLSDCADPCWWVLLDDEDIVLSVNPMDERSAMAGEHWRGDWLSPMGIDLQINGGLGLAFTELTFEDLPRLFELLDLLWADGVEAICPTFISCSVSSLHLGLDVLRAARKKKLPHRCELLGAHLEGPFLAKDRNGFHSLESLCLPSLFSLNKRIGGFEDEISLFTLAPELPGSSEVIERLRSLGIIVSIGHSNANSVVSNTAFENGVSMLTHAFNAMLGLQHRSPGPVGEAIKNRKVSIGLIADGIHVHPNIAVYLQRLASDQLLLVSDAISPYGLKDGRYKWDQRDIFSEKGSCRLENGTLAGTTISLLQACQNLAKWSEEPSSAIWSATIAPRMALDPKKKSIDFLIGQPLKQLLRWTMNPDHDELSWHQAA